MIEQMERMKEILNKKRNLELSTERKIFRELDELINGVKKAKEHIIPELKWEYIAFDFAENPEEKTPYFVPKFVGVTENNERIPLSCSTKDVSEESLDYWKKRLTETDDPILQFRYAGLIWEFSNHIKKQSLSAAIAKTLIDAAIELSKYAEKYSLKNKLEIALRIAVSLNYKDKIKSIVKAIIKHEDDISEIKKYGTWGFSFTILIEDSKFYKKLYIEEEQEKKIINDLETKLAKLSSEKPQFFDLYGVEHITSKLAPYYKRNSCKEDMKRVLLLYKDSFLALSEKSQYCDLEKVMRVLLDFGLSQEASSLEPNIRKQHETYRKNLKKQRLSYRIPQEGINKMKQDIDGKNLHEALQKITINNIPNLEEQKKSFLKIKKGSPISYLIPIKNMDHTDRTITEIYPDDEDSHFIQHMCLVINLLSPNLILSLEYLEKTKELNSNTLSQYLFQSPVFFNHQEVIKAGLDSYFLHRNYIAACHVLTPMIEAVVREIVLKSGGKMYVPNEFHGFDVQSLGALLRKNEFDRIYENKRDIIEYFKVVLIDKRGLNLRNNICHGIMPYTNWKFCANIIMHLLLILSLIRKENKKQ